MPYDPRSTDFPLPFGSQAKPIRGCTLLVSVCMPFCRPSALYAASASGSGAAKLRRELNVIAHAQVQRKVGSHSPRVLKVNSQRLVGKTVIRIADSLNEILRNSQAIRLQSGDPRDGLLQACRQRIENRAGEYLAGGERSKIIHAAIIHGERRCEWDVIEVHAKLHAVLPVSDREIVGELVPLLGALNVGIRFPAEVCVTRNIHGRIRTARRIRIEVRQSPPRILETKFVHFIVADSPRVLKHSGNVAISLLRGSRVCVLAERLTFASHFDTRYSAGADVRPQHDPVIAVLTL